MDKKISSKTLWQIFFVILGLLFLYAIREIAAIFLFALIIASAVDLMVQNLTKLKIPRTLGVIMIYLMFILVLAVLAYFIIPLFVQELKSLAKQFPELLEKISEENIVKKYGISDNMGQFLETLISGIQVGSGSIIRISRQLFGGLFAAVSIFVISLYLSLQEKGI
ncbi:MAG: AI-2E family transporter, partial [bacterium]|nr:AI-2E family transporter [bacterium]